VLAGAVALHTGKKKKNRLVVFERGENLLQNGILLHFTTFIGLSQSSGKKKRQVKNPLKG